MKRLSRVFSGSPKPVPEKEAPQQTAKTIIEGRSVDEGRPLRVVVIGAGISGILACIRFVQRIPNIDLCIYDKNADIGGTWVEVSLFLSIRDCGFAFQEIFIISKGLFRALLTNLVFRIGTQAVHVVCLPRSRWQLIS